jgi:tetratricopeptide (TPR) repeat protein
MASFAELLATAENALGVDDLVVAERNYRAAIDANPAKAEPWQGLGMVRSRQRRHADAADHFRKALRLDPNLAESHNGLGKVLHAMGYLLEAVQSYQAAIRLDSELVAAQINLGALFMNLSRFADAESQGQLLVRLAPDFADGHRLLGRAQFALGRHAEAASNLRRAIELDPQQQDAHHVLGNALWTLGRFEEARTSYENALRLRPDDALTLANLALVLSDLGLFDDSFRFFERALALDPRNHETHRNRSLIRLLHGDYARGWPEYEWRFGCAGLPARPLPRPLWDGAPLNGRTILIHTEQGLGDTIQFVRYLPLVKARGGRVILISQPALSALFQRAEGIDVLLVQGDPIPPFDVHAPLLSLPRIFGTTLESIPAHVPYLMPDPDLLYRWKQRLDAIDGFKVGIAWQGSPTYRKDLERSFPLRYLAPLAAVPGVRLISLQKGYGREQIASDSGSIDVLDLSEELDEVTGPFLDTAAVLNSLDLVISPDTVLVHLAGALGVPTWVALAAVPHWPWLLNRDDNPWYPTVRLFRQPRRGDWDDVFRRMTRALQDQIWTPSQARPIRIEISPGDLLDKIVVLGITAERTPDPDKRSQLEEKLADLQAIRDACLSGTRGLAQVLHELKAVNEILWEVEETMRRREMQGELGPALTELTRAFYQHNNRRAALKRQLDARFGDQHVGVTI